MTAARPPRVVLVGGTGFTGGLVAREVLARGLPLLLTGRDPAKLRRVAGTLEAGTGASPPERGGDGVLETAVVDAAEPTTLSRLLSPGDVVASCAGPFTDLGHPVIGAAIEAGAHYLDTTGEQRFMMEAARRWDGPARERGVAVVNALAFEYAPGDAACAVAAERLDARPVSLDVTYAWGGPAGGTSPGTRASILRVLARPGLAYEGGEWREEPLAARRRTVRLDGEARPALSFPSGEVVTAARDPAVERVRGWMVTGRSLAMGAKLLGPLLPPAARALRPVLEPVLRRVGPREPSREARRASEFVIRAEARGPDDGEPSDAEEVGGRDPYGLTARLMARGAEVLLEDDADDGRRAGVLRPSRLLPAREILEEVG